MSIEIIDTKVGHKNHVSKFGIVITQPKKYITGKQIMKYKDGDKILNQYLNQSNVLSNPNFKLCGKSRKDISKCKNVSYKKRQQRSKKQRQSSKAKTSRSIQTSIPKSKPSMHSMQTSPMLFSQNKYYNNDLMNNDFDYFDPSKNNGSVYESTLRTEHYNNSSRSPIKPVKKQIKRRKNPTRKARAPLKPTRKQPTRKAKKQQV